jgi:hypothetical protein
MASISASRSTRGTRALRRRATLLVLAASAMLLVPTAEAGTMSLAWDAAASSDLAGYRVYYGQDPALLDRSVEIAAGQTSAELAGLADCTLWHASVRAFDEQGLESASASNAVKGFPRPRISIVEPAAARRGEVVDIVVDGTNFDAGDPGDPRRAASIVDFSSPSITVLSTTVESCGRLRARVRIESNAAVGASMLYVLNPDLSHANPGGRPRVFAEAPFEILSETAPDTTAPSVASTTPGAGSGGVEPGVRPTITFDEPIDPTSVGPGNVQLIASSGVAVAQAAGSPQVAGATVTIFPSGALESGTYRLRASGVRDLAGNSQAADFEQSPGFTVSASDSSSNSSPLELTGSSPAEGEIGVSRTTSEIRVVFDRDMSPLFGAYSLSALRERFAVTSGRSVLAQSSDSPRLEDGGRTVVLLLAESLRDGQAYTTVVNLAGSFASQLDARGLGAFKMAQIWTSRPAWRVEGGLESVTYTEPETGFSGTLAPNATALGPTNTGVPVGAEFSLSFSQPVAASSATSEVFRVLVRDGRRYQPVPLAEPVTLEDEGRTVVIRPASALPAGAEAVIDVRTGPRGVILEGADGSYDLGGSSLQAPFATEVTGAAQDTSLAVGN